MEPQRPGLTVECLPSQAPNLSGAIPKRTEAKTKPALNLENLRCRIVASCHRGVGLISRVNSRREYNTVRRADVARLADGDQALSQPNSISSLVTDAGGKVQKKRGPEKAAGSVLGITTLG